MHIKEAMEVIARAITALEGLERIYRNHDLGGEPGHSSAADQCADLYELMESLGLAVT
jgi:hypothetical protein